MKDNKVSKVGRPTKEFDKKTGRINVRFSETELSEIVQLSKYLGITKTEYIRQNTLKGDKIKIINLVDLLNELSSISTEMGRIGNNINQLAKHANSVVKISDIPIGIIDEHSKLLSNYIEILNSINISMRNIYREISK